MEDGKLTWELAPGDGDHEPAQDEGEGEQAIVEIRHSRNNLPSCDDPEEPKQGGCGCQTQPDENPPDPGREHLEVWLIWEPEWSSSRHCGGEGGSTAC